MDEFGKKKRERMKSDGRKKIKSEKWEGDERRRRNEGE